MIKIRTKAMGLTQIELAKRLKVSLPTLKRWFGGGTITLESLQVLANEIGLSLTEVFASVEKSASPSFRYTQEQEIYFSSHPDSLAYFDNLLRGMTPAQIQKKFRLPEHKTVRYLGRLEKLKLIQWLPKNRVRLLVNGEPVWKPGGPLGEKLRNDLFQKFLRSEKREDSHFLLHDYLKEDQDELARKIRELIEFAKRANSRAKFRTSEVKPMGIYVSLQNFRWDLDQYLVGN